MTEPTSEAPVVVRPVRASDLAFIYRTWLDDLRQADASPLPNDLFFPAHREYLNRVLTSPATTVKVLAPTDRPDDIMGYIVVEDATPGLLQWLYLRPRYRGKHLGLVPLLLSEFPKNLPLAWRTPDSKKLKNPLRSRQSRGRHALPSTGSPSAD